MNWLESVLSILGILFGGGSIVYLIVNKKVLSQGEKAEADSIEKDNQNKDISTGLNALNFYSEIRAIVEGEVAKATEPLYKELTNVNSELKEIKDNWCCYRQGCEMRLWTKAEAGIGKDEETHSEEFIKKM